MNNFFHDTIARIQASRRKARRYTAMLLVLAMLTSISVSWRLHYVGTALTTDEETFCGLEEHTHTDACYEDVLVCGYEEGELVYPDADSEAEAEPAEPQYVKHEHTDDCYQDVEVEEEVEEEELTCGLEEHTHDETCPVDPETGEYLCGYEEHTHDETCYSTVTKTVTKTERQLVCGYEEGQEVLADPAEEPEDTPTVEPEVHHHDESCYEKKLVCTIPEHTHTLECYADWSADTEDEDKWEQYSAPAQDDWNTALLTVAQSQLGYTESEKNFTVDEALGETVDVHHYTRYGAYYGSPYADWDVLFVSFCQHYAGIPLSVIPQRAGLLALRSDMDDMSFAYLTEGEDAPYVAIPGDIVTYYNADGDETIGIVEDCSDDTLTVISGAVNGTVARVDVLFANVTSTIRVDDAYADTVGEPTEDTEEPDADHDDEVSVQPGEDATNPVASNADVFDITNAIDLKSLSPAPTMNVRYDNGHGWKDLTDGVQLEEGNKLEITTAFTIPAGTFSKDGNLRAYYQLPVGFTEEKLGGHIALTSGTKETIGTVSINEDGLAVLEFNPDASGFDVSGSFEARFVVEAYATWNSQSDGSTVTFPGTSGNITITLKKNTDISITKAVSDNVLCDDSGHYYLLYTVTVSSENGTHTGKVDIRDEIQASSSATGHYSDFTLTKQTSSGEVSVSGYTPNVDSSSFKIEGLDPLNAGESYVLTYRYYPDQAGPELANAATLNNRAFTKYDYGDGTEEVGSKQVTKTINGVTITKTHSDDSIKGQVTWNVLVSNPDGYDLAGFYVDDFLSGSSDHTILGNITVKKSDNNKDYSNFDTLKDFSGETSFNYTFPDGSTNKYYRFTYSTLAPSTGSIQNQANIHKDKNSSAFSSATDSSSASGFSGKWSIKKDKSDSAYTINGGQTLVLPKWDLTVQNPSNATNYTLTDVFSTPSSSSSGYSLSQYAPLSELDKQLKNNLTLYTTDPANSSIKGYNNILSKTNATVTFQYYRDQAATDLIDTSAGAVADEKVCAFKITLDWSSYSYKVTQLKVSSYSSYVDISALPEQTAVTVTNQLQCAGQTVSSSHNYSYTKPSSAHGFKKLVSVNDTFRYFQSGTRIGFDESDDKSNDKIISYENGKKVYFKLWLQSPNTSSNTLTITDTLPKGMTVDTALTTTNFWVLISKDETYGTGGSKGVTWKYLSTGKDSGLAQGSNKNYFSVSSTFIDGCQQLTFTLTDLNTINPENENIGILYMATLSDEDYWQYIDHQTQDYPNTAHWEEAGLDAAATVRVTRAEKDYGVSKTALTNNEVSELSYVTYQLAINPSGSTLLSGNGNLVLTDTFVIPQELNATLDLSKVILYEADQKTPVDFGKWAVRADPNDVTIKNKKKYYKMEITVPDGSAYYLQYTYNIDASNTTADVFDFSNDVTFNGHLAGEHPIKYHKVTITGEAKQDLARLTLHKVDAVQNALSLPNVTFRLDKLENGTWTQGPSYSTDSNGEISFVSAQIGSSTSDIKVDADALYRLVEVAPCQGYTLDETPHYFMLLSKDADSAEKFKTATQGASDAPAQGVVQFVPFQSSETMQVTNARKQITLTKYWETEDGSKDTSTHDPITVNLYKYQGTAPTASDLETPVATITLSDSNGWTYTYPQSGDAPLDEAYHYFIRETSAEIGYQVSYCNGSVTVDDDSGISVFIGDHAIITNKQRPSYELPSTGGSGTAPYLAVGGGLMAAAALLLARKRRKAE